MEDKYKQLLAKLQADTSFVEKLFGEESPEEVQSLLKAEGMNFSLEEILTLREALVKGLEKTADGGELSDEDLEGVAGGFVGAIIGAVTTLIQVGVAVHFNTKGKW